MDQSDRSGDSPDNAEEGDAVAGGEALKPLLWVAIPLVAVILWQVFLAT